ncbi:MAG: hypothetical protein EZS28_040948, partial [Streblomastix strix]
TEKQRKELELKNLKEEQIRRLEYERKLYQEDGQKYQAENKQKEEDMKRLEAEKKKIEHEIFNLDETKSNRLRENKLQESERRKFDEETKKLEKEKMKKEVEIKMLEEERIQKAKEQQNEDNILTNLQNISSQTVRSSVYSLNFYNSNNNYDNQRNSTFESQQQQSMGVTSAWSIVYPSPVKGIRRENLDIMQGKNLRLQSWRNTAVKSARKAADNAASKNLSVQQQQQQSNIYKKGKVKLGIKSLNNLPDNCVQLNKDIFVQVQLGSKAQTSRMLKSAFNVDVNEEFETDFDPKEIEDRELFIEVFIRKDDDEEDVEFLAGAAVSFLDFLKSPQTLDLKLIGEQDELLDECSGEILLDIVYLPDALTSKK